MKLIYKGKTKDVYRLKDGTIQLKFKDDVTGEDGQFDPGANTVGATVEGIGQSGLRMSVYFFEAIEAAGIPTHYISSDVSNATMTVKDVDMFGDGIEVICRYRAVGSFYKRYGAYCEEGQVLNQFIEMTLKDDERGDPPISKSGLTALSILTEEEYDKIEHMTRQVSEIVKDALAEKDLELYDLKFEFGREKATGEILLIDEVSGGNMRVYKGDTFIEPLQLESMLLSEFA